MTDSHDVNQRCSVCGKSGPEKACSGCVKKYGNRFDLSTADGRYEARVAEQGTYDDRSRQESNRKDPKLAKLREQRESLVLKLFVKLDEGQKALREERYLCIAEVLKDVGRLARKIQNIAKRET